MKDYKIVIEIKTNKDLKKGIEQICTKIKKVTPTAKIHWIQEFTIIFKDGTKAITESKSLKGAKYIADVLFGNNVKEVMEEV